MTYLLVKGDFGFKKQVKDITGTRLIFIHLITSVLDFKLEHIINLPSSFHGGNEKPANIGQIIIYEFRNYKIQDLKIFR